MFAKFVPQDGRFAFSDIDNGGVEISEEYHAQLFDGQSAGKVIVADESGHPILVDRPAETKDEALVRALTDIRKQRAPILTALDGIAGRYSRAGDTSTAAVADAAIVALLDITKLQALVQATTYDEMKAAVLARYREIAGAAPAIVQSAFIETVAP